MNNFNTILELVMISNDEAKFYHENGHLVVEDVYTQEEISVRLFLMN